MKKNQRIRRIIQFSFLLLSVVAVWQAARFVAHEFCPYAVICFGIRGLNPNMFFVFLTAIFGGLFIALTSIVIGRRFCGYVCPLGTVIEYLNYLNPFRSKVRFKRIPPVLEIKLRLGKYIVLIVTAALAFFLLGYLYFQICPVMLLTGSAHYSVIGVITLSVVLIGSLLITRFWCRYLCGYGALMNCFQFITRKTGIKRFKIYRNLEICNDCKCCEYGCQMNIEITDQEYIEDLNCIYCLNCINSCPKKMCLTITGRKE